MFKRTFVLLHVAVHGNAQACWSHHCNHMIGGTHRVPSVVAQPWKADLHHEVLLQAESMLSI